MDNEALLKLAALGDTDAIRILIERGILHASTIKKAA